LKLPKPLGRKGFSLHSLKRKAESGKFLCRSINRVQYGAHASPVRNSKHGLEHQGVPQKGSVACGEEGIDEKYQVQPYEDGGSDAHGCGPKFGRRIRPLRHEIRVYLGTDFGAQQGQVFA